MMQSLKRLAVLGVFLTGTIASAQNTFPASGNVGIGTTSPMAPLDTRGTQTLQNPSGGDYLLNLPLGGSFEDPNTGDIILLIPASSGSPVNGSQFEGIIESNRGSAGSWNLNSEWYVSVQSAYTNNTGSILPLSGSQEYASTPTLITCVYNGTTYVGFQTPAGNSSSVWSLTGNWSNGQNGQRPLMVPRTSVTGTSTFIGYESVGAAISIASNGNNGNGGVIGTNVGIGTTSPGYTLDVAGKIHTNNSVVYPDGSSQNTAWTGVLCGGDYAEAMNASGGKKLYEPGDVLVLTSGAENDVQKSAEAYSTMVAGIYATKPGVIGRRQSLVKDSDELPMAMVGVVPTKVTAENGPIHKGDLLVSSSKPGYAMRGTDRSRMLGAVIGKAMGALQAGDGVIEVLVTLQ